MAREKHPLAEHSPRGAALFEGWVLHYFLVLAIGVVAIFISALPVGKILSYQREASQKRAEAARLYHEADSLREKGREARSPAYVERMARERLGLARPGEVVFVPVEGPWPEPHSSTVSHEKKTVPEKQSSPTPTANPKPSPRPGSSASPKPAVSSSPKPAASATPRRSPTR